MSEFKTKQMEQYEVIHSVSSGKLSQVWQGYTVQTGEPLFLEMGQAGATTNGKFTEIFTRRIHTIRQLEHPNLPDYMESGINEEGRPFVVLPQRAGESLASWMQTKELTPIAALRLVRQVADGLAAAHAAGIIHEDLRPEMIFITEEDWPILFGLGFSVEDVPETAVAPDDIPKTLDYPAPEVQDGKPPSNQSNIYSLGIILYELLAQAKPRLPDSAWDIFERRSVPQPIPLEQDCPGLTPATYQVVKTCLWWQKWNRYQTMAELIEALNAAILAEEAKLTAPPPKPRPDRRRIYAYAGVAALLLVVAITGGWLLLGNQGAAGAPVAGNPPTTEEPTIVPQEPGEPSASDAVLAANLELTRETVSVAPEPTATPTTSPMPLPSPTPMPTVTPTATAVPPTATATPSPTPEGMVLIPAGTFLMGSNEGQAIEAPVHEVSLSAFLLDQFEVSNAQYRACVDAGACTQTSFPNSFTVSGYRDDPFYDDYPVVGVTWDQAFFYCSWADKRLPTEAEWEYAARGPENLLWPWGNSFDPALSAASAADVQPVDSYPEGASPFGVYNLAGNVAEWVLDVYDGNYYTNAPTENPLNQADGLDRVFRGGSFDNLDESAYLTYRRYAQLRTFTDVDIGFRCAADVPLP